MLVATGPFLTVPIDLVEYAEAAITFFRDRGFKVKPEHFEVGFPDRPTIVCTRQGTKLIVEVTNKISRRSLEEWNRFGSSCSADTQFALCVPHTRSVSGPEITLLQKFKAGLYVATATDLEERIAPVDLALRMFLPEMRTLPRRVGRLVGPVYEQVNRGQWREAFKKASQVLEEQCRRYLKAGIVGPTPRIVVLSKAGQPRVLNAKKINKLSLGQLAEVFGQIQKPNQSDALIGQVLASINPDRVNTTHFEGAKKTEKRLRGNVGQHMWRILAALKAVCK